MSKRKRPPQPAQPSTPKATSPTVKDVVAPPLVVAPRKSRRLWWIGGIALLVVGPAVVIALVLSQPFGGGSGTAPQTYAPSRFPQGGVLYCTNKQAPFIAAQGFSRKAVLDTRSQAVKGLRVFEPDASGNPTRIYQHPSWASAGFLGPAVVDKDGAIYTIPIPAINLLDNPLDKANIVYRIDPNTGQMQPLINLPTAQPPNAENPYGLLGLTYDCDTHSLYASSVAGSSRHTEVGRIYRIDVATAKVIAQIENTDAFGVAVYNGAQGKRLYYGLARNAEVRSISLDDGGNFRGAPRDELSLADQGYHGDERARQISVPTDETLSIRLTQFDFNLVAPTEVRQTALNYRYNTDKDVWEFTGSAPTSN